MANSQDDLERIAEDLNRRYHESCERYTDTSDKEALEEALGFIKQAVQKTEGPDFKSNNARAGHLSNLGRCYILLFDATGLAHYLADAIDAARLGIKTVPSSSDLLPLCHINLSNALSKQYLAGGRESEAGLREALDEARRASATAKEGNQYYGNARSTLASCLSQYYEHVERDDRFLDEAVEIGEDLVKVTPQSDELSGAHVFNLAGDLHNKYQRYGNLADLISAKEYFHRAVRLFPKGHHNHNMAVRQYAEMVYAIVDSTGESGELEQAIESLNTLVDELQNKLALAQTFLSQSRLYDMKYKLTSETKSLNDAIHSAQKALDFLSIDSNLRTVFLRQLSMVLSRRAELRLSIEDIDAAIELARQSVDAASGSPARQSAAFRALGERLAIKYTLFGGKQNFEAAIKARRQTVDSLPEDHHDVPMALHALAISLRGSFEQFGRTSDLDESIAMARKAVKGTPESSADRCMALDGLSMSLSMRYKLNGNSQDLEDAVSASEAAVGGLPKGRQERYGYLNNLGNRLVSKYEISRDKSFLDRAIEAVTEAVSACHDGSEDECIYLNTLGNCFYSRFEGFGDTADLEACIDKGRQYLRKLPTTSPGRVNGMHNLGLRLQAKYFRITDAKEKEKYLREALDLSEKCVEDTPLNHPDLPTFMRILATRQLFLAVFIGEAEGEDKGLEQMALAATTFETAANMTYDTPLSRIKNCEFGGFCLMQGKEFERASRLLSQSVMLFNRASPISLGDQDRQRQLKNLSGISSLACASYLSMDQPEKGIEILEAGRGIMADIAMGYHSDLSDLKAADESLHNEYVTLRNTLSQPLPESSNGNHAEDPVAKRNQDLARFEDVEESIRSLPGLEAFNRSLTAKQIQELAVHGPLISFCTVDLRCDAIIVTQEKITAVSLPDLRNADLKCRIDLVVGEGRLSKKPPSKRATANKHLRSLLEWIWDKAVRPVLKHLNLLSTSSGSLQEKPRIWWVTSGAMGLLPLHAAGKGTKVPSKNVYAHVVSSYVPTFASLAFARQCQAKVDPVSPNMALITMPQTPGGLGELNTEHEAQAIRQVFATASASHKELLELCLPSANDVLTQVRGSNIDMLHLACHAEPNLDDPSNTALLFGSDPRASAPEQLPVRRLRQLPTTPQVNRRPPRLAYLSACCTAQQYDLRLIDENIHLAAAFQLCGFPAVVGTLWEADDTAAVIVAGAFYKKLFELDEEDRTGQSEEHVARALDYATSLYRGLKVGRASAANDALAWAGFVHIGA